MTGFEEQLAEVVATASRTAVRVALEEASVGGVGPLLYDAAGAAELLSCSRARVHELWTSGELEHTTDGPGKGRHSTRAMLERYHDRLDRAARVGKPLRVAS